MKKVFLLAVSALLITGVTFADNGKKHKKGAKSCCKKGGGCCKGKEKTTAKL